MFIVPEHDLHGDSFEERMWWVWYGHYLDSKRWRKKRRAVLKRAGGRCESTDRHGVRCDAQATTCHHLTYARCGDERLEDLLAVCPRCHELRHPPPMPPMPPWFTKKRRKVSPRGTENLF